jgi:hypothetical protein
MEAIEQLDTLTEQFGFVLVESYITTQNYGMSLVTGRYQCRDETIVYVYREIEDAIAIFDQKGAEIDHTLAAWQKPAYDIVEVKRTRIRQSENIPDGWSYWAGWLYRRIDSDAVRSYIKSARGRLWRGTEAELLQKLEDISQRPVAAQ